MSSPDDPSISSHLRSLPAREDAGSELAFRFIVMDFFSVPAAPGPRHGLLRRSRSLSFKSQSPCPTFDAGHHDAAALSASYCGYPAADGMSRPRATEPCDPSLRLSGDRDSDRVPRAP
jgi:hypothetical protein